MQSNREMPVEIVFYFLSQTFQSYSFLYSLSSACLFAPSTVLRWERPLQSIMILWTSDTCEFDIRCTSAPLCYWTVTHLLPFPHVQAIVFQTTICSIPFFIPICLNSSGQLLYPSFCLSPSTIIMCIKK